LSESFLALAAFFLSCKVDNFSIAGDRLAEIKSYSAFVHIERISSKDKLISNAPKKYKTRYQNKITGLTDILINQLSQFRSVDQTSQ
jgi:hypothetical protein